MRKVRRYVSITISAMALCTVLMTACGKERNAVGGVGNAGGVASTGQTETTTSPLSTEAPFTTEATTTEELTTATTEAEGGDVTITVDDYSCSKFTMKIPQGWTLEQGGDFGYLWFKVVNPENPEMQFFFYGSVEPFWKSEEARQFWANTGQAQLADAPVMTNVSAAGMLDLWDECIAYQEKYEGKSAFTTMTNFAVQENSSFDVTQYYGDAAIGSETLATCTGPSNGACAIRLKTTIADTGPSMQNNIDVSYFTCKGTTGYLLPQDMYNTWLPVFETCVNSFAFTQEYLDLYNETISGNSGSSADFVSPNME